MRQKVSLFFAVLPFQIRNPVRMPPEVSRDELRTKQKILAGVAGGICEQVSGHIPSRTREGILSRPRHSR